MFKVEGEWPVSYHGTKAHSAHKIALEGFDGKKGKRFKYGRGIYSTPDPEKAEKYATGKSFKFFNLPIMAVYYKCNCY